jgi:predicted nucleotidyltransferase
VERLHCIIVCGPRRGRDPGDRGARTGPGRRRGLSDLDDLLAHRHREEIERLRDRAEQSSDPVCLLVDLEPAEKRTIREAMGYGEKRHEWLQRAVDLTFCGTRLNHLPPLQQMIERAIRECAGV